MISDLFKLLGYILKYILIGFGYIFKYVGWYIKNMIDVFKNYPKKSSNKVSIKGEIF